MSNHTKGHEHKLNIACLQCIKNKYDQYDLLLKFVKKISELKYDSLTFRAYLIIQANDLLKQIGEV